MHPTNLQTTDNRELVITWSDDAEATIPFQVLRKRCQCAGCNEKRVNPPEKLAGFKMHPVGNYAYNIHFSDGHSAGIYTFEMLRNIGDSCAS